MSSSNPYDDSYQWPNDLFDEMHDMSIASFFIYTFSYIVDAARKSKEAGNPFTGVLFESDDAETDILSSRQLSQSLTPEEIKKIVVDNVDKLGTYYPEFKSQERLDRLFRTLDGMTALATSNSSNEEAITLEEFDDEFQTQELVYGVMKDNINKRIVLIFRGTTNSLAFWTNWTTNATIVKKEPIIPDVLKGKFDGVRLHSGFYNYIFNETVNEEDSEDNTKYKQILADIKPLLEKYPDHKLYVTGHSLGGALSTLASFYLATDPDIPKPVSCINFAAPRVGNEEYFKATQYLEKTKQLRILRGVNQNDAVTAIPTVGYRHVGFQVTLFKENCGETNEPVIHYPRPDLSFTEWLNIAWNNSVVGNFNIGYDHGDYRERVVAGKDFLQTKDLNKMYTDPDLVGYSLE